ncbi:multiple monosaccharide ABC transporter substrate-binding protein [Phytomonospora endophytica]|uniref:Putative multiple sugar transport system substrate-binding protein n=1 Tax=Phytomonospora endophytica TaxID=714109 RepID=A0A841FLP8_9ACTN|nr:multiple monosaccharide ABC transporter substrate-binding protein [Phytomonospora endophytica]MBB6036784.1 putative multiple sugar transport system substrate-binding protein [Phytomonospora endophytica]GIG68182.1 sugar ABC transporter substrate-binding protein [Phytomonospora endophytica]
MTTINRRGLLAGVAGLGALLATSACSVESADDGDGAGEAPKKGTIGIAMPTKSSERWVYDGDNLVKEFTALGYTTDLQFAEDVIETQVSQVENMITKGVQALLIAAVDNKSFTAVLQQAKDAKIPVIAYDRLIRETENVDYYATFDNLKVGVLQASYIEEKLKLADGEGPFNIELFAGSADDNNTSFFFNGAMQVLQPYLDSKKLVVRSGQTAMDQVTTLRWDGATAQSRMETLLSANYSSENVDAVLSPYDGISIGIISALKSVGYGSGSKKLPIVTGQDAELASVKSIIAGEQTQTVFKDLRELAKLAVTMTDAAINGKPATVNDTTSYDNGKKVVPTNQLDPVSVDKDNYKQALVDTGFYTEAQLTG